MRATVMIGVLGVVVVVAFGGGAPRGGGGGAPATPVTEARASALVVSGPFVHENLAVYLIHGEDRVDGRKFATLEEAMDKKLVIVHETSNVGKLHIENVSGDVYV